MLRLSDIYNRWISIPSLLRTSSLASGIVIVLLLLNLGLLSWFGYHWYQRYQHRFLERAEQALIADDKAAAIRAFSAHLQHYQSDGKTAERLEELKKEYRRRYLDEADSLIKVGDKVAAIKEYRSHIQHYPDDYDVQLKLAKLYEELGINDSAESLYRGILEELGDSDSRYRAIAQERLLRHVNEWANNIKRQADKLFDKGEFIAAAEEYARVISLRSRNPALNFNDVNNRFAVSALSNVVAKRAFSLWRAGQKHALKTELRTEYDAEIFPDDSGGGTLPAEVQRQRETMLANFFWDYADNLFDGQSWGKAAEMYDRVLEIRKAASAEDGDPNTPILLLNYALSEYRAGNPRKAYKALQQIRSEYAYHEKARVSRLMQEVEDELGVRSEE